MLFRYPNEKEGTIDKKYANLVNKKKCAEISNKIDLKKYMNLGVAYKIMIKNMKKISGDCLKH